MIVEPRGVDSYMSFELIIIALCFSLTKSWLHWFCKLVYFYDHDGFYVVDSHIISTYIILGRR